MNCAQCDEKGWFLYKNRRSKRLEVRACDLCEIFSNDEAAGDVAVLTIIKSIELSETITKVREDDSGIRKTTAGAFGERARFNSQRG